MGARLSPTAKCDGSSRRTKRSAIRWNPAWQRVELFEWSSQAWGRADWISRATVRARISDPSPARVGVSYADTWCEPVYEEAYR